MQGVSIKAKWSGQAAALLVGAKKKMNGKKKMYTEEKSMNQSKATEDKTTKRSKIDRG